MLTHSLSVSPLYLLLKDHKGWSVSVGGAPPTRPVCSAGSGQNDHMSEIISMVMEPMAKSWVGGMEANSTPDFVSKIDNLNERIEPPENIDLEEVDK